MSTTTTTTTAPPTSSWTIRKPNLRKFHPRTLWENRNERTSKISILRVIGLLAYGAMWGFGLYYGLIAMPSLEAFGSWVWILVLVALTLAPLLLIAHQKIWVRYVGAAILVFGGGLLLLQWQKASVFFHTASPMSVTGFFVAVIVTVLMIWWLCRVPRVPAVAAPPVAAAPATTTATASSPSTP